MPAIPNEAKKPTDRAAKAEAKSQFIEFDHDGQHYTIDRDNADNLELMEFVEDEQYIKAIRGYVGLDQWAKFKDANRDEHGRVTTATFEAFLTDVMAAIGGKLTGLAYLLREHGEALEADFERYYRRDLCGLWRGEMTPRKAGVLASQLPAGAQTWVSCGYDSAWSQEAHLAALTFDALQVSNWQRGGGSKSDMPTPLQRPSDLAEKASKRDRMAARAQAAYERQQATQTQQPEEA